MARVWYMKLIFLGNAQLISITYSTISDQGLSFNWGNPLTVPLAEKHALVP